jgi:uncharacterized protein
VLQLTGKRGHIKKTPGTRPRVSSGSPVIQALLDGGADPAAGTPSAVETARMFGNDDLVALMLRDPPED